MVKIIVRKILNGYPGGGRAIYEDIEVKWKKPLSKSTLIDLVNQIGEEFDISHINVIIIYKGKSERIEAGEKDVNKKLNEFSYIELTQKIVAGIDFDDIPPKPTLIERIKNFLGFN